MNTTKNRRSALSGVFEFVMTVTPVVFILVALFPMAAPILPESVVAATSKVTPFLSAPQEKTTWVAPVPSYYTESRGVVVDNVKSNTKKVLSDVKSGKIDTCDELIKVWKPSHLRVMGVKVECVDVVKNMPKKTKGLTTMTIPTKSSLSGPFVIQIKRGGGLVEMMDVYQHEAFHVLSASWSTKKQEAFLSKIGAKAWLDESKGYREQPTEIWAWGATSCNALSVNKGFDDYDDIINGGCSTVKSFMSEEGAK